MASSLSGSSLFQGARQVPDGFWLRRAVHTGWGSGEALSCWVRMVAEARDENRDKRHGCSTASVPPLKSNRNVGKATWFSGSSVRPFPGAGVLAVWAALASGLLFRFRVWAWSRRVLLALLCCLVSSSGSVSRRGDDPGHRPKDRFFSDRPTTRRASSPWWPGVRGDDPRTDPVAGIPFNVRHYSGIGGGCWVLTLAFIVDSSFFVFSSCARLFEPTGGGWWKNLHV